MGSSQVRVEINAQQIRIFILAKPGFYLDGIKGILSGDVKNIIVACVQPGSDCQERLIDTAPEIILVHHQAIEGTPAEFFSQIILKIPLAKIIVFGQNMSDAFLQQIVRAGANGYLNDAMSGQHLLDAIRKVYAGELWVERRILERLVRNSVEIEDIINSAILALQNVLTKRETEVFKLVLEGLATKEIAHELQLSEQSVKLHLGHLFRKFDVTNRSQLILLTFQKICPVNNVMRLFRMSMDRRKVSRGDAPLISDPLDSGS